MLHAAGEAVRAGAALHDALAAEPELRQARARALASHLDAEYVERCIAEAGRGVDDALRSVSAALVGVIGCHLGVKGVGVRAGNSVGACRGQICMQQVVEKRSFCSSPCFKATGCAECTWK